MNLGILVNTNKNAADVVGITKAAVEKGHTVALFFMDGGTHILPNKEIQDLCSISGVKMAFCDHSLQHEKVSKDGFSDALVCGSQFDNANMMHDADKVITL
jgi:predicted peroxiredoxin